MKQSTTLGHLNDADEIDHALVLLGAALEAQNAGPFDLAVIGGAALNVLGLCFRPTRDVDVVALLEQDDADRISLASARPLPDALLAAGREVARALGIADDWLNDGPTDLLDHGLPRGFEGRLMLSGYGSRLTVWFASRQDLIALKAYAAADLGPGRHVEDLQALAPSREELVSGVRWARTHDESDAFRAQLSGLLILMGYEDAEQEVFDD
jgi:hypothetical protein